MKDATVRLTCSVLGIGHLPVAPGTWASAAAAGVYLLVRRLAGAAWWVVLGGLLAAAIIVGLLVCPAAERVYGRRDPEQFVLDEFAGLWAVTLGFWWRSPLITAVAAFVAFRIFDVAKPFPLRRLERLPGGWGVMADDVGASLYSIAVLWPVFHFFLEKHLAG